MTEVILRADALAAGYGGERVVRDVSFAVRAGEIVTLVGANGAGKTTLLRAIAGQLAPLAGTVFLDGRALPDLGARDAAQRLSILTTARVRADRLTVRDVVSLGRYPYTGTFGVLSARDRAAVEETMARLRVSDLAERRFDALSDGQRQRVMLARAVCQEPEVLVLDEPTSYLDVRHELETLTLLRKLARERGVAVVLSLHDLALARRLSDTILAVRGGVIDRAGAPEEVFADGYIDTLYDLPRGAYESFFGTPQAAGSSAFFQNRACEKFPCHAGVSAEEFNCLFCYCPLYALGEGCGGKFRYTETGKKSCVDCDFPHHRENYREILARYGEIAALASARYVRSGQKLLRRGYTTGACAALAAGAAARLLLTGEAPETARFTTPGGVALAVAPERCERRGDAAFCAVRKDAGDDPDATDGCLVCATVQKTAARGVAIDGGDGVGRVTRVGLDQPVGAAAINAAPRRMITAAVEAACREASYGGGLSVVISVPDGEALARKTFNPLLGVAGGISILGTIGVVEPMSERAIVATVETELRQKRAEGAACVVLVPGNYGEEFLRGGALAIGDTPIVKYSNFTGDALDLAALLGYRDVLLVGHIGKLVKLAGGAMNTHSKYADCRAELFCAHAALCGADAATCRRLMDAATADACLAVLDDAGLRGAVMDSLLAAMQRHLTRRVGDKLRAGAAVFSNAYGLLGATETARDILKDWGA